MGHLTTISSNIMEQRPSRIPDSVVLGSKPLGSLQVNSAFHLSHDDQMSIRNLEINEWALSIKI